MWRHDPIRLPESNPVQPDPPESHNLRITIVQGAFLPVPPLRGGAIEKIWFALGQEFVRRGHQVVHLSRRFPGLADAESTAGVRHLRVSGYDAPRSLLALKLLDLCYSWRALRKLPPADILVTNTFWLPALLRSEKFGKLYVHVARYPRGQMRFYRHAARLQTVSRPIQEAITAEAPALADRIRTIPNPVIHTGAITATPREKQILYVGRIHPEKGLHLLIEALRLVSPQALADWKVNIIGPAAANAGGGGESYEKELQQLAAPLGDRVRWVGPIFEAEKLGRFYGRSSLFVYPSIAERGETFGVAPLEAMACGCPPLVSALACFRDFIDEDINGFVFNHRSANPAGALAEKLGQLLQNPTQLAHAGERAWQRAQQYSVERIASQYLEDFQSLDAPASIPRA